MNQSDAVKILNLENKELTPEAILKVFVGWVELQNEFRQKRLTIRRFVLPTVDIL